MSFPTSVDKLFYNSLTSLLTWIEELFKGNLLTFQNEIEMRLKELDIVISDQSNTFETWSLRWFQTNHGIYYNFAAYGIR